MKTLAQLKRLKKDDLKAYAVENFDIELAELNGLTNPEIISEIQDAGKDKAAEVENARLDAEEAMIESIFDEHIDGKATSEHWETPCANTNPVCSEKIVGVKTQPVCFGDYGKIIANCNICAESDSCKRESKVGPCKGCPHSDLAFKEGLDCCAPNSIIENCNEMNDFKYKTLAYPQETTPNPVSEEKIMPEFETPENDMTPNFVIKTTDARLSIGSLKKAKSATEAVQPIPAVKAVAEIKDEAGNITQASVVGVSAVAGKAATPATPACQKVYLIANTDIIMDEVVARMADQGFAPLEVQREYVDGDKPRLCFTAETAAPIRAAFKAVKAKDGYNAPGLKIEADEKKAAAKLKADEEKAKKAAEKTEDKEPETSFDGEETIEEVVEESTEDTETDGWPGEDFPA